MRRLVITFYSYKGGVGRTQALANIAVALANRDQDVVLLDMDLESPGLHAFFSPEDTPERRFTEADLAHRSGLLDFLEHCQTLPEEEPDVSPLLIPCAHELKRRGQIRLLPPGKLDESYAPRLARFSWEKFYAEKHGYSYLELLRAQLFDRVGADVVLIDSRTGLTDSGMVGTFQLPDVVIILFALHAQGIEGARRTAGAIARQRAESEGRLERVLLVPARVDEYGEAEQAERWAAEAERQLRDIPGCELLRDFNQRIPYYPKMSYGEQILDLDANPNPLSVAYKHLADRLVSLQREPGLPSPSTPPPAPPEPLLPSLRLSTAKLKQGIDTLAADIDALTRIQERIRDAPRRAHEVVYRQETLLAELDRVEGWLSDLQHLVDPAGAEGPSFPHPDSVQGWRELSASLEPACVEAIQRCHAAIRERLIAAAHQDVALVDQMWPDLEEQFKGGSPEDLAELIREAEERLRGQALRALLRQNALTADIFERRIPAAEGRRLWLDERIQDEIDRADDSEAGLVLRNLLRLRVDVLDPDEGLSPLWNAYDVACLLLREASRDDQGLFRDVGARLWSLAWRGVFYAEPSRRDVTIPAGLEAQEQLQRVATQTGGQIDPIIETILEGLAAWARQPYPERTRSFLPLFQTRRRDRVLRAAIMVIAERRSASWREVLAAWLVDCESFEEEDRAALRCVLHDLVREDRDVEAFYALCATGRSDPRVLDDERFDDVYVALAATLLRTGRGGDLLAQILADFELSRRLSARPSGRALLAILKGKLSTLPAVRGAANTPDVQRAFQGGTPLPESVIVWLNRRRHDPPYEGTSGTQIRELISKVEEIASHSIYTSWDGSPHYERKLSRLLVDALAKVRSATRTAGAQRTRLPAADEWMTSTLRELRDEGVRISAPVDTARNRIIEFLSDAEDALDALWALCPEDGRTTLHDLLQAKQERDEAIADLRHWLAEQSDADPSGVFRKVRDLLENEP